MPAQEALLAVRVWDLPTRLFHWLLALAVLAALGTAWVGESALQWHMRCGLVALALLVFRLAWGLVGGRWSRFGSFVHSPATVLRYLRGEVRSGDHFAVGHNPLGSLSVITMLLVLLLQVATGLVADDEVATTGPLNRFVTTARGLTATSWHHGPGQWLIVGLIVVHVGAIAFYRLRSRTDLVGPMLSGDKPLPAGVPASTDSAATRLLALALAAACVLLAVWIARLGS